MSRIFDFQTFSYSFSDEIIKHHNGLLFVESAEGEGTTVTVVLPTVKAQPDEITEVIFPPEQKNEQV